MKSQKIRVNTKGGLLAAYQCAKEYEGPTEITLQTKSGEIKTTLEAKYNYKKVYNQTNQKYKLHTFKDMDIFHKRINTAKTRIRKIPAEELLS